jgi:hypothetical protein
MEGALDAKGILAALAILVSLAALAVTLWSYHRTAMTARKPVPRFEYAKEGWALMTVGNGPAPNVVVARKVPQGDCSTLCVLPARHRPGRSCRRPSRAW